MPLPVLDLQLRGLLADLCFLDEREQGGDRVYEILRTPWRACWPYLGFRMARVPGCYAGRETASTMVGPEVPHGED